MFEKSLKTLHRFETKLHCFSMVSYIVMVTVCSFFYTIEDFQKLDKRVIRPRLKWETDESG